MIRSSAIVGCCIIYKQTKAVSIIVKLLKKFTMKPSFVNLLWLVSANAIIGSKVESFLFNGHANVSGSPLENGYYNIYSKIDYLEKALQNLETSVQQNQGGAHMLRQPMLVRVKINAFVLRILLLTPVQRTDKLFKNCTDW